MGIFHHESYEASAHDTYYKEPHKAKLSHELIAAAASYEAAKAYHHHQEKEGKPVSHEKAKEIIAGLAGAFIDREVETHGLDLLDKHKAKHEATHKVYNNLDPAQFLQTETVVRVDEFQRIV